MSKTLVLSPVLEKKKRPPEKCSLVALEQGYSSVILALARTQTVLDGEDGGGV
jgi:hypothetical protein